MVRLTTFLAAAATAAALLAVAPPAEAATYASTGQRCTIVGTNGPDRLVGTSRSDVICGRGGDDVIRGGGGNDVIDAGRGDDVVRAGTGNDRVVGGTGADRVSGESGADRLDGGSNGDRLAGGPGTDTVLGSSGDDLLDGGEDGDLLQGQDGRDRLLGRSGNDDLAGGPGTDYLDGGAGTNWCDEVSRDRHVACAVDREEPEVVEVRPGRSTVDVTAAEQTVSVLARVTDDTGVRLVRGVARTQDGSATASARLAGQLVRGTVRDGWWRLEYTVPRYFPPGDLLVEPFVNDRLDRRGYYYGPAAPIVVTNADPDLEDAVVQSFSLSATSVDVRTDEARLTARVRVTDDRAGAYGPLVCLLRRTDEGYRNLDGDGCFGTNASRGSTPQDSRYAVPLTVPRNAPSGSYVAQVCVQDRIRTTSSTCWISDLEAAYEHVTGNASARPLIPGGGAGLEVVGLERDTNPPQLVSVTTTPTEVEASTGARRVHLRVAARDAEGLRPQQVRALVTNDEHRVDLSDRTWPTLVSGTPEDGVWEFEMVVPGGTPTGRYRIDVMLTDNDHQLGWSAAGDAPLWGTWAPYTAAQSATGGYLVVR